MHVCAKHYALTYTLLLLYTRHYSCKLSAETTAVSDVGRKEDTKSGSRRKAMLSIHVSSTPPNQTPSKFFALPRDSSGVRRAWDSGPGAMRRRHPPGVVASAGWALKGVKKGYRAEESATPLPSPLLPENIPQHVAIIMDGNSRWAKAKGLPTPAGHVAGYRAMKEIVMLSRRWGVKTLTLFGFSHENWRRPKQEVDFFMLLFEYVAKEDVGNFINEGVRIRIIGDTSNLPNSLKKLTTEAEDRSSKNTGMDLQLAISYSARRDITFACQKIAQKVKDGLLEPEDIKESAVAQELGTSCSFRSPDVDLLIRTSGELRLSNFLLWEAAYAELFFTQTLWPDFGKDEYVEALSSYSSRQRRFGLRS